MPVGIQTRHMINHEVLGLASGALPQRGSALVWQSSSLAQQSPRDMGVALLHLVLSSPVIDCQPDLITSSVILRSHFVRKTALLAPA